MHAFYNNAKIKLVPCCVAASARDQVIDLRGELTYPLMTHCPRFAAEIIAGQSQSNINTRDLNSWKEDVCVERVGVLSGWNCKETFEELNSHFLGSVQRFEAAGTRLLFSLASYRQSISTYCCTTLQLDIQNKFLVDKYSLCVK